MKRHSISITKNVFNHINYPAFKCILFVQNYGSVSSSGSDGFPSHSFKPGCSYTDVNKLLCQLKEQLEAVFNQEINETFQKGKTSKHYVDCLFLIDE